MVTTLSRRPVALAICGASITAPLGSRTIGL
jgi:hypothetical protein